MDTKSSLRTVTSTSGSSTWSSTEGWAVAQKRLSSDLSYMHRPPRIMPNYGKKYKEALRLKTKLPRVLLYDNVTEQTVLDVQLSSIVSQRSKAKRELELQKKSFVLRKQFKDKALKKLTKVYHGRDYEQFQQEYYGYMSEGNNDVDVDDHFLKLSKAGSLPDIRVTNKLATDGSKMRNKRATVRMNSDNALSMKSSDISADHHLTTLPPINDSLLHAPDESKSVHELNPQRRVGFSYDKGRDGTTRIFHTMSRGNSDVTHDAIAAITDANQPEHHRDDQQAIDYVHAEHTSAEVNNKSSSIPEVDESVSGKEKTFNISRPLLDIRFELLQKVLVRQDPPNEGFLELSPSFQRTAPLKNIGSQRKEKQLDRPIDNAHTDRTSKLSRGVTPVLSEDNSSDSEEDGANERRNSITNDAIKRLGAF